MRTNVIHKKYVKYCTMLPKLMNSFYGNVFAGLYDTKAKARPMFNQVVGDYAINSISIAPDGNQVCNLNRSSLFASDGNQVCSSPSKFKFQSGGVVL